MDVNICEKKNHFPANSYPREIQLSSLSCFCSYKKIATILKQNKHTSSQTYLISCCVKSFHCEFFAFTNTKRPDDNAKCVATFFVPMR